MTMDLGQGMQRLHGVYATHFNRRYGHDGHVFKRPFRNKPIKDEVHLVTTIAYVGDNPVSAGLCERPADWRRSSFSVGGDPFIDTVAFGADRDLERQFGQAAGAPASAVARRASA